MKLTSKIINRTSIVLLLLMLVWSTIFYFIIIDEINDETDDSLEDYSEQIIIRALTGELLPSKDNGTNNSYHIVKVTEQYAMENERIRYSEEMVYLEFKKETEPARVLRTIFRDDSDQYYELTVSIPTIEKADLREVILWWFVLLYLGMLIAIISVNYWVINRSFRPFYAMLKWLDKFSVEKEYKPFVNKTNITEFRKLEEAVSSSARRSAEMYEQQKLFIGHASHELQTPLAICRNRLEILAEDPGLTEKQLEEVMKTCRTFDHVIKLNKTLLLLTKIENGQYPEVLPVNVNKLLRKILEDYSEIYAYRNLTVTLEEKEEKTLLLNETLANVLYSNLIKNAFVHNLQDGAIRVEIGASAITFSNSGEERPLDAEKIFKRFYRESKKESSSGLGLSLVKSICKHYGLDICYIYDNQMHAFVLSENKTVTMKREHANNKKL